MSEDRDAQMAAEQAVERAEEMAAMEERAVDTTSQQPRFTQADADFIFGSVYLWTCKSVTVPEYKTDSRKRDVALRAFWRTEPHWSGIINSVCLIDANRGWSLVGGRNQVRRYASILSNADGGAGWRTFIKKAALSYYTSDMCTVVELGRDGQFGPLRALFNVDPTRCRLTGNIETPLWYIPSMGKQKWQKWDPLDFFRVVSMPSDDEKFYSLGWCATSRAIQLVRLLYSVMAHDEEKAGARVPEGLLLLSGITMDQWEQALRARKSQLDAQARERFSGVMALASTGSQQIDAKLFALSQLPENFNRREFIDQTLYGYALTIGYDPSEFWPVQFGALGRGKESEIQHKKATGKGGLDFALSFQEKLQIELPVSVLFEFAQRDDAGDQINTAITLNKVSIARGLYEAGLNCGASLLSRDEARSLLAIMNVIPRSWAALVEKTVATDLNPTAVGQSELRERLVERAEIRRAIEQDPDEPIVRYTWPLGVEQEIWAHGRDAYAGRPRPVVKIRDGTVLYEDEEEDIEITEEDVDDAISAGERRIGEEFEELLTAEQV